MAKEMAINPTESSTQTPVHGPRPAGNSTANVPTTVAGALSLMSAEAEDLDITLEALAARHEVRTLSLNDEEVRMETQEKEIIEQLALLDDAQSKLKLKRSKLQDAKARQRTELRRQKKKIAGNSKALKSLEQQLVNKALVGDSGNNGAGPISATSITTGAGKSEGQILAEALYQLLDANHDGRVEKSEFRKQLRSQEDNLAVQALYRSSGIVLGHHASNRKVKKLFDAIDEHHMVMAPNGKRYIDLAQLIAFCDKKEARMPTSTAAIPETPNWRERQDLLITL
jgi:Ca2+-binding EF-hand superfamily protein